MPSTTGTAISRSPCCPPIAATRPATSGAKITDAPIVATQPPSTDPHDVAGARTILGFAIDPLSFQREKARWRSCKTCSYGSESGRLGERCLCTDRTRERRGEVRVLPGEIEVRPTEVPVRRGLAIDRTAQLEAIDDRAG